MSESPTHLTSSSPTETTTTPTTNTMEMNERSTTTVQDLEVDALAYCANYLNLQELSNMAMTCKLFRTAAYSDCIWRKWYREHWPQKISSSCEISGARESYLSRRTAVREFKFDDPSLCQYSTYRSLYNHMLLDDDRIILAEGSRIQIMKRDFINFKMLLDHDARITCMRLFPLNETSLYRRNGRCNDKILITSSSDHSIRLWWEDRSQRCFRGHNGPVTTIADKLLGDGDEKLLASGGEDSTVRLWSITSSGKRGQHALKKTFYGHEKPISFLSVSGHNTSLLVSISKDSKVRVWDTIGTRCVGMTSMVGTPVDMKCHESLCYIAAGSFVTAIDLRTMRKAFTAAFQPPKLHSFSMLPSKSLICTGGPEKAMLWDVRNSSQDNPKPVHVLEGHEGRVSHVYMDAYKIVTGSPSDPFVKVWETNTGNLTNSLMCGFPDDPKSRIGCSSMAVSDCLMVTASCGDEPGLVCARDYINATSPISTCDDSFTSKFWGTRAVSDTDIDTHTDVDNRQEE